MLEVYFSKIAKDCEISVKRIRDEIGRLAFTNLEDYVSHGEDGKITVDLSRCTREQMAAIQEFTVVSTGGTGDGKREMIVRTKIKFHSKIDALQLAARILGILKDKLEVTDNYEAMTDDELSAKARMYAIPIHAPDTDPRTAN